MVRVRRTMVLGAAGAALAAVAAVCWVVAAHAPRPMHIATEHHRAFHVVYREQRGSPAALDATIDSYGVRSRLPLVGRAVSAARIGPRAVTGAGHGCWPRRGCVGSSLRFG
jgi:hypothetical protein